MTTRQTNNDDAIAMADTIVSQARQVIASLKGLHKKNPEQVSKARETAGKIIVKGGQLRQLLQTRQVDERGTLAREN